MVDHQVVCFGEILFDILGTVATPGGAPFNVAYHLKQTGVSPFLISSVGDDAHGKELREILQTWGLDTVGVATSTAYGTGAAVVRHDENNQPTYDLVYPVAWDHIPWKPDYAPIISRAGAFVFGSLSSRNKVSYETLKECLRHASLRVFDINLRPPYVDRAVLEELLRHTHILKLNNIELDLLSTWYGRQHEPEKEQVAQLCRMFAIDEVILTKGEDGASYYSRDIELHQKAIPVEVADTVGSGDAFLAGFLSKRLDRSHTIEASLQEGIRRGAFVASQHGACPSYDGYPLYNDAT